MLERRPTVGAPGWIMQVVGVVLVFLILGGIVLALVGGIGNDRQLASLGGALVLLGIMPLLWLIFSDMGQALLHIGTTGRGKK